MRSSERAKFGQIRLKDGFYIEVCSKGMSRGVKIWSETKKDMDATINQYASSKNVIILGEMRNGVPYRVKNIA